MIDSAALRSGPVGSVGAGCSEQLDFAVGASIAMHALREAEAARVVLAHIKRGERVLDLGSGAGWSTLLLAAKATAASQTHPTLVAWDADPAARRATREHVTQAGFEQRIEVVDQLPASCRFDLVFVSHRMRSDDDTAGARMTMTLRRAATLLHARGRIAVVLPAASIASGIAAVHRAGLVPMHADSATPVLLPADLDPAGCVATPSGDFVLLAQPIVDRIALPVEVHTDQRSLLASYALHNPGVLLEHDLDAVENECERHHRKRRDAEVLCGLAASHPGPCLDLGTSHGRSAFKLATNIGAHAVTTVNMLPEQAIAAGLHITHVLQQDEIGSYPRQRGVGNIHQLYANTLQWDWAGVPDGLHLAFVDACHDTDAVLRDSQQAWRRLAPGGFLVWHDFSPALAPVYPWIATSVAGVRAFVQQVQAAGTVQHLLGSWCGVLRKGAGDDC